MRERERETEKKEKRRRYYDEGGSEKRRRLFSRAKKGRLEKTNISSPFFEP